MIRHDHGHLATQHITQCKLPRHTDFSFIFNCTYLLRALLALLHDRRHSFLKLALRDGRTNVFLSTTDILGLVIMVLDIDSAFSEGGRLQHFV